MYPSCVFFACCLRVVYVVTLHRPLYYSFCNASGLENSIEEFLILDSDFFFVISTLPRCILGPERRSTGAENSVPEL